MENIIFFIFEMEYNYVTFFNKVKKRETTLRNPHHEGNS